MDKRSIAKKAGKLAARQAIRRTPQGRALLMASKVGKLALRAKRARDAGKVDR